jgi:hypothetical protein
MEFKAIRPSTGAQRWFQGRLSLAGPVPPRLTIFRGCMSTASRARGAFMPRGLTDGFTGRLLEEVPCGSRVIGHWKEKNGLLQLDYMPIESPRLFGLAVHGGDMAKHYEQSANPDVT